MYMYQHAWEEAYTIIILASDFYEVSVCLLLSACEEFHKPVASLIQFVFKSISPPQWMA